MNTNQISNWLKKRKPEFQAIAIESGLSVPTLYSLVDWPGKKRQKRVLDAISKYIDTKKVMK